MTTVPWPNAILMRLPRSVRGRYMARLVQKAFGVPRPVVLAGIATVALLPMFMGLVVIGAIIDAVAPWGPQWWSPGSLLEFTLGLAALQLAGSCIVAALIYRRMRPGLLGGQLTEQGGTARLRSCPNCAYDQAGTTGSLCPECGCAIAFTRDELAAGFDDPALGAESRGQSGRWPFVRLVLLPGAAAGLTGLLAFGAAHAALIAPIWARLSGGWPFALLGGTALAWGFHELTRAGRLRGRCDDAIRFGTMLWVGLIPMNAFGLLVRILNFRSALGPWEVVFEVALALGSGVAMGWLLTRRRRAASALGAATLALGLATGGPIALATIDGAAIFAWMLPICVIAALPVVATRRACGCAAV